LPDRAIRTADSTVLNVGAPSGTWGCTIDLSRPLQHSSPFVSSANVATDEDEHHNFNGSITMNNEQVQIAPVLRYSRAKDEQVREKVY